MPYVLHEFEDLTLARVYLAQNHPDEVLALLAPILQTAEKLGRVTTLIETLTLQALAYQAQCDLSNADAALTRALTLAEPEGYIRLFVDEGEPMKQLLERLRAEDGRMKPYLQRLLTSFTPPLSSFRLQPLLSDRELEVLRLLAAGRSNQEIAQQLVIATGTVKKHLNNIYDKLQIHSRTQAIVRACELQLL